MRSLEPMDAAVIERRHIAVLARRQALEPGVARMHDEDLASRLCHGTDEIADKARATLRRPVNIRRIRPETWNASDPTDPFIKSVKSRPLVTVVGSA